jgi:hypothetical protein
MALMRYGRNWARFGSGEALTLLPVGCHCSIGSKFLIKEQVMNELCACLPAEGACSPLTFSHIVVIFCVLHYNFCKEFWGLGAKSLRFFLRQIDRGGPVFETLCLDGHDCPRRRFCDGPAIESHGDFLARNGWKRRKDWRRFRPMKNNKAMMRNYFFTLNQSTMKPLSIKTQTPGEYSGLEVHLRHAG